MSQDIQDNLRQKYGETMMIDEVARELRVTVKTLYHRRKVNGDFDIPSQKTHHRRIFLTVDVANYLRGSKP